MRVDKKARGSRLRFVVLDGLARPAMLEGPDDALLEAPTGRWQRREGLRAQRAEPGPARHPRARRLRRDHATPTWWRSASATGEELGLDVEVRQTDAEHELLGWLHAAADEGAAVVLNPARLVALLVRGAGRLRACCAAPLVEVHISNIHAREEFRHHSVVSAVATGVICGLGVDGYRLALHHLAPSRCGGRDSAPVDAGRPSDRRTRRLPGLSAN